MPGRPTTQHLDRELDADELAALTIQELSIRKGLLFHRRDKPRWRPQWLATRDAAWQRRREHTEPVWCVVANVVRERPYGPGGGSAPSSSTSRA